MNRCGRSGPLPGLAGPAVRWTICLSLMLTGALAAPGFAQQTDQAPPPADATPEPSKALAPQASPRSDDAASQAERQQHPVGRRLESLMTELISRLTDGQPVTRRWLARQLHHQLGQQGLRIEQVQLCQRVQGFGVYDPFEQPEFPAGQENPMIVYVELDQFRAVPNDQQHYQVRLTSDISLIDPADGLAVWRHPTETIIDTSRNRRLDFFMVQLIRLPAAIAPGQYQLRVRVADLSNDSVAQAVVDIRITTPQ